MKKIIAFILAAIMVMSLAPASVFAAFDGTCQKTHTMKNCKNEYVKTVPATCTEYGYDIYACVECGAEIFDNFVEKLPHTYPSAADKDHVDKAATCTANGYKYVYACEVCDGGVEDLEECNCGKGPCKTEDIYKLVDPMGHLATPTGNGIGCGTEYYCSRCQKTLYKKGNDYATTFSHTWDYSKAEVVKPAEWINGELVIGSAVVKCSAKDCTADKKIDITGMDCQHYSVSRVVKAAEADCTTAGSKQVLLCADCQLYYVDANKNDKIDANEELLMKELEDGTFVYTTDLSAAVIPATGHDKAPTEAEDFKKIEDCEGTYTCSKCEKDQTVTFHTGLDEEILGDAEFPATCTTPGYKFQFCSDCRTNYTKTLEPTGHTTVEVTIGATCANPGATYTICLNDNCSAAEKWYVDASGEAYDSVAEIFDDAADEKIEELISGYKYLMRVVAAANEVPASTAESAHKIIYIDATNPDNVYDEKPEASCDEYIIVKTQCAYGCVHKNGVELIEGSGHDEYILQKFANCKKKSTGHKYLNSELQANYERVVYICKDCGNLRYEDTPIARKSSYASEEEFLYYHGAIYYEYNSSTETLEKKDRAYGNYEDTETHLVEATCSTEGRLIYYCYNCVASYYVIEEKTAHVKNPAKASADVKPATCKKEGTLGYFTCKDCNKLIGFDHAGVQKQIKGTKAATLKIKKHGSTLAEYHVSTESDKECVGRVLWKCTKCDEAIFTDSTASTAYNPNNAHHNYKSLQTGKLASCANPGRYEIQYCNRAGCNRVIVSAHINVDGTNTNFIFFRGHRDTEDGKYVDTTFENVLPTLEDGAWVLKSFTVTADNDLSGDYDVDLPAFDHSTPFGDFADEEVEGNIYNSFSDKLIDAIDLDEEDDNRDGFYTIYAPQTSANHTEAGYTSKQCVYCVHEYFEDFQAFSEEHVNVSGQVIPTDCNNNTVTDKFCIYCQALVTGTHIWTTEKPLTNDVTCVQDGYNYLLCSVCGYRNILGKEDKDPEWYHAQTDFLDSEYAVVNGHTSDYAHDGTYYSVFCLLCEQYAVEETESKPVEAAGLEIYLESDSDVYIPGATVKVAVVLDSLKGVDVWSVRFPVTYDPAVLEFVGFEMEDTTMFPFYLPTDIKTYVNGYNYDGEFIVMDTTKTESIGVISVIASADEYVTIKGATPLMVLEFKVKATSACRDTLTVEAITEADGRTYYQGYKTENNSNIAIENEVIIPVEVLDDNSDSVKVLANGKNTETVKVANFLDLDGKGGITMLDAYQLYSIIFNDPTGNAYNPIADADHDGMITGMDLAILYQVLTGATTIEQLVNPKADVTPKEPRIN